MNSLADMKVYLGGTFDPVHYGHIHFAQELVSALDLSKLYLMPCYEAVHKDTVSANANQRLEMLRLATIPYPALAIDDREIKQTGPSFTYDSLLSIRNECNKGSVCFVMGVDSLLGLSTWYNANKFHELTNLIVIDRPASSFGISEKELTKKKLESFKCLESLGYTFLEDVQDLSQYRSGKVVSLTLSMWNVSSTEIRSLIKSRETITHLVGANIAEYIRLHKLYT